MYRASLVAWNEYAYTPHYITDDIKKVIVKNPQSFSLNFMLSKSNLSQIFTKPGYVDLPTSFLFVGSTLNKQSNANTSLQVSSNEVSISVKVYDKSKIATKTFSSKSSIRPILFSNKFEFDSLAHLVASPLQTFSSTVKSSQVRAAVHIRCCTEFKTGFLKVYVRDVKNPLTKSATTFIKVKDAVPDTFSLLNQCLSASQFMYNMNNIPEFSISVPFGEFCTIFEVVDDNEAIDTIYYKPFGIAYDDKSIYGRIIVDSEFRMLVKLKSGQFIKLRIKPFKTKIYKSLFNI